jgi:hypothetical protein
MLEHAIRRRARLLTLMVAAITANAAGATDYLWTGAGESAGQRSWSSSGNWTPPGVPGPDDTATIGAVSGYSIAVGTATVRSLSLDGASLSAGTLTIAGGPGGQGAFTWSSGRVACTVHIAAGAALNLSGGTKQLDPGGVINHAGTATWTAGTIGSAGGVFNNSGTFVIAHDGTFTSIAGDTSPATFNNTGILRKAGSSGTARFAEAWALHSTGVVDVQSGVLELNTAGNRFEAFGGLTGPGRVRFVQPLFRPGIPSPQAELRIDGPLSIDGATTLEIGRGAVLGGSGSFGGGGTLNWTGGEIQGDPLYGGTWILIGPDSRLLISGDDDKALHARARLQNSGMTIWRDGGDIGGSDGSVFLNHGAFIAENDARLVHGFNGGVPIATFENAGTFSKSGGTGETVISGWSFVNEGAVNVQSGILTLHPGGFDHVLGAGSRLTGRTRVQGAGGVTTELMLDGPIDLAGPGAVLEVGGLTDVTTTGDAAFSGNGTVEWNGGTFTVTTLTFGADTHLLIGGPELKNLHRGTIESYGEVIWTGTGHLQLRSGSTFNNHGAFVVRNDALLTSAVARDLHGFGHFRNSGTFTKEGGAGLTIVEQYFENTTGTVNVNRGTLLFSLGPYTAFHQTGGATRLAGGSLAAAMERTGEGRQALVIEGGTLGGDGTIDADVINGGVLSPGRPGAPGSLALLGDYQQTSTGELEVQVGGPLAGTELDQLTIKGAARLDGTLRVSFLGDFAPARSATFQVVRYAIHSGKFAYLVGPTGTTVSPDYDATSVSLGFSGPPQSHGCAATLGDWNLWPMALVLLGLGRRGLRPGPTAGPHGEGVRKCSGVSRPRAMNGAQ